MSFAPCFCAPPTARRETGQVRHDAYTALAEVLASWRLRGLVDLDESSGRVSFPAATWAPLKPALSQTQLLL